eukprot:TRINITY_DN1783_c0_g1_i1.p1 TRINITY_DN1783_c0_g1~~TRINITY_DN1783_c0_g1_i1.p1  ORF type:complete len:228 (+),score=62.35 TRINITY_DN1783_c0_g1_i1:77-685(+)
MKGVRIPQVRDQKIISEDVVHQGKFIRTKMITYNRGAEIKKWEGIERCTRTSDTDVAAILTIVKKKNEPDSLVLVRQFRPATGKYSVEFPAGLIDKGETAEQAALRELKEETGYQGKVISSSPTIFADPGISSANMSLVHVEVDADLDVNKNPVQQEEDALIRVDLIPVKSLLSTLKEWSSQDYAVDANVYHLALGLGFNSN